MLARPLAAAALLGTAAVALAMPGHGPQTAGRSDPAAACHAGTEAPHARPAQAGPGAMHAPMHAKMQARMQGMHRMGGVHGHGPDGHGGHVHRHEPGTSADAPATP